jgi:hypothetical protein
MPDKRSLRDGKRIDYAKMHEGTVESIVDTGGNDTSLSQKGNEQSMASNPDSWCVRPKVVNSYIRLKLVYTTSPLWVKSPNAIHDIVQTVYTSSRLVAEHTIICNGMFVECQFIHRIYLSSYTTKEPNPCCTERTYQLRRSHHCCLVYSSYDRKKNRIS